MIEVSVVVPTLGRLSQLEDCLKGMSKQTYSNTEILIVHNDKGLDSTKALASSYGAKYIRGLEQGAVDAYNTGVRNASGKIIAFTDDDAIPDLNWVEILASSYGTGIGGVGGAVQPSHPVRYSTRVSKIGRKTGWTDLPNRIIEVDHLRGANMSFTREAMEKTGLFDPNYVADGYAFETDYCVRMKRKGFKILFNPAARVFHNESPIRSVPRSHSFKGAYYHSRNFRYFTLKNFMGGKNTIFVAKDIVSRDSKLLWRMMGKRDPRSVFAFLGSFGGSFCYITGRQKKYS